MDHKSFVTRLSPQRKEALTTPSTAAGLWHLAGHIGLLIAGAIWIGLGWPLWWLVLLPYGVTLVFLFTLEHECTHKTPFANTTLNEVVGHATGLIMILPFQWFWYFHLAHHRWTNIPDQDPELAAPRPDTWGQMAWHITGLPYWWAMIRQVVGNAFSVPLAAYVPKSAMPRIRREAQIMLCLYVIAVIVTFFVPILLWIWIIPALIGQPFLRVYLLAEHGRCPPVANMFENTRTTITSRAIRFIAWNMPYHAEHHIFPAVPFHKLPELHEETRAHLQQTSQGYVQFAREYAKHLE